MPTQPNPTQPPAMTDAERESLRQRLAQHKADLDAAYLNEDLDKPPKIRFALALIALKETPVLLDALDARDAELARLQAAYLELLETHLEDLVDSTAQGCQRDDGTLDSACISTWAANIRTLAQHGRVRITKEYGRGVEAVWVSREEWPPLALPETKGDADGS